MTHQDSAITIIGLGPGDADGLSRGAERALREASQSVVDGRGTLFLRTEKHPVVQSLRAWGLRFETFDSLYDAAPDFGTVYAGIVEAILRRFDTPETQRTSVAYAVPGHPLWGESSVQRLIAEANARKLACRVVASESFLDSILAQLGIPLADGCDIRDAMTLLLHDTVDAAGHSAGARLDTGRLLVLFQVFDSRTASHTKLCLMRDYPDDWEVTVVRWAGIQGRETVRRVPLHLLDREPCDHLTTVLVPPLPAAARPKSFEALVGVMARLRAPDGCPWDREQSHATLKPYFVEETYEVLEAIDQDDVDGLCEELGDVLLQVVFHAQLAAEEGTFNIDDVTAGIVNKLVRRHPHVFGTTSVADANEVLVRWEQIKREEKARKRSVQPDSILDGIPRGLPALMRAAQVSKRVAKVGFDWPGLSDVLEKLDEEVAELKAELEEATPDAARIVAELGDLLFTAVQIARWQHIDPEEALNSMVARFTARFRYIEAAISAQNRTLSDVDMAELDTLWNEAKKAKAKDRREPGR